MTRCDVCHRRLPAQPCHPHEPGCGRYPEAFRGGPLDPMLADVVQATAERVARAIVALEDDDARRALRILTNQEG